MSIRTVLALFLLSPLASLAQETASQAQRAPVAARGTLRFDLAAHPQWLASGEAGDVFTVPHKARRWGRYEVRLAYTATAETEVSFQEAGKADTQLKAKLKSAANATTASLGTVYLAQSGQLSLVLALPKGAVSQGFAARELFLTPAPEGGAVSQAKDGSVLLLAKDATTFSENMRFEPNPVKNCLGFWTEKDDYAAWTFTVEKPGRFAVTVHQGNGAAGGSEVAVVSGGQRLSFTVKATGGYQKWQALPVGELVFEKAGQHVLEVRPEKKSGPAVMDIQKIELKPL